VRTFAFPVEAGHLLAFARAIGEPGSVAVAPPTFAVVADHFDPEFPRRPAPDGTFAPGALRTAFHVEQTFEIHVAIRAGMRLRARRGPGRAWVRQGRSGGRLEFVEERTDLLDEHGSLVASASWVDVHTEREHATLSARDPAADARAGSPPPPAGEVLLVANLSRTQLVMYQGAAGDFHPLHHDELYARAHGYPSVFAPGMLTMALSGRAVTDLVGVASVRRFGGRFRAQVWPGDTLRATVEPGAAGAGARAGADQVITVTTRNQHGVVVFDGQVIARRGSRADRS
jgi:acyl dehydratase